MKRFARILERRLPGLRTPLEAGVQGASTVRAALTARAAPLHSGMAGMLAVHGEEVTVAALRPQREGLIA